MVGGAPNLTPDDVTRADQGVLFLDELAEFDRDVLESLRQPLEEGRVVIARAGRVTTFPARFQLVAAMNPCPCGYAGSLPEATCRCNPPTIERYFRPGSRGIVVSSVSCSISVRARADGRGRSPSSFSAA